MNFIRAINALLQSGFSLFPPYLLRGLISLLLLHSSVEAAGSSVQKIPDADDPLQFQGYISGRYISRSSHIADETVRDEDAFSELRLDMSRPKTNSYELHLFGTLRYDILGDRNGKSFYPYEDIGNTSRHRTMGQLYEAHLALNKPFAGATQIRIGRQDGLRDEPVFFDGIAADFAVAQKLAMTVYGGASVHFFELDNRWGDDRLAGIGMDLFPLSGVGINLDYLYVDDKLTPSGMVTRHDHLASFRMNQRFSPNLRTTVKARSVNDDPRDIMLRAAATAPDAGLEIIGSYFRQFRLQNELSNEFSPYYDILGQSSPYQSYDVKTRVVLGRRFAIDLGYFQRSLLQRAEENAFNRSFRRTYAVLDITGLLLKGLSLSIIAEHWRSGPQDFSSSGYDLGYAFKQGGRSPSIHAGSYYSLYKYDYYLLYGERTSVRTDYVKLELPFARRFALSGSFETERSLEAYKTAKMGMRYEF